MYRRRVHTGHEFDQLVDSMIDYGAVTRDVLLMQPEGILVFRPGIPQVLHGLIALLLDSPVNAWDEADAQAREDDEVFTFALQASTVRPLDVAACTTILLRSQHKIALGSHWTMDHPEWRSRHGARSELSVHVFAAILSRLGLSPTSENLTNHALELADIRTKKEALTRLFDVDFGWNLLTVLEKWNDTVAEVSGRSGVQYPPYADLYKLPDDVRQIIQFRTVRMREQLVQQSAGYANILAHGEESLEAFYTLVYLALCRFRLSPSRFA